MCDGYDRYDMDDMDDMDVGLMLVLVLVLMLILIFLVRVGSRRCDAVRCGAGWPLSGGRGGRSGLGQSQATGHRRFYGGV